MIGSAFEYYNTKYDKCLLAGDFNAEVDESTMNDFLENFGLKSLVKQNTCFKSINNPSCIDLFLTNLRKSFLSTTVISTGISDFHKMAITVMRTTFNKMGPRKIIYRNYKKFNHALFRHDLEMALNEKKFRNEDFSSFQETFIETLNIHAPKKEKFVRANEVAYMNKTLRKSIMTKSRLEIHITKVKAPLIK